MAQTATDLADDHAALVNRQQTLINHEAKLKQQLSDTEGRATALEQSHHDALLAGDIETAEAAGAELHQLQPTIEQLRRATAAANTAQTVVSQARQLAEDQAQLAEYETLQQRHFTDAAAIISSVPHRIIELRREIRHALYLESRGQQAFEEAGNLRAAIARRDDPNHYPTRLAMPSPVSGLITQHPGLIELTQNPNLPGGPIPFKF